MPKVIRDEDGLSPAEGRFAAFLCQGLTQREAFKKAWPKTRATDAAIDKRASELASRPQIKGRCNEIFKAMKVSDLDSQAKAYADLVECLGAAITSKNWTAAASFQRLRMDALGMLKSNGAGLSLSSISDETLLEKLAGANAELRRQLTTLLGTPTFQKPDEEQPSTSKH